MSIRREGLKTSSETYEFSASIPGWAIVKKCQLSSEISNVVSIDILLEYTCFIILA
jgi:hypothetical protein